MAWAPNNKKLAVATSDRSILLFNDLGEKKDKFNTKPAVPEAGKKSYSITCKLKTKYLLTSCMELLPTNIYFQAYHLEKNLIF